MPHLSPPSPSAVVPSLSPRAGEQEEARLRRLYGLDLLDTEPEPLFDAIARTAAAICHAPIALITLIDRDRQWFKARVGLDHVEETPRSWALCDHSIQQDELLEIPDVRRDPRFWSNPLVMGGPRIAFYAGAPIRLGSGDRIGTVCVIDQVPRRLEPRERQILVDLAMVAARAIELRETALRGLDEVPVPLPLEQDLDSIQVVLEALAAREATFRGLAEQFPLGVFLTDAQGQCTYANPRWQSLHGMTAEEAHGLGWVAHLHPDDRLSVASAWENAANAGAAFDREYRVAHPDGSVRLLHGHAAPMRDAQGGLKGFVGSVSDVSAQRKLEQRLRDSEALLDRANRLGGLGGWMYDLRSGEAVWTSETCRIHEVPTDYRPTPRRTLEFFPADQRPRIDEALRELIRGHGPRSLELRMRTARGRMIWVQASAEVDLDAQRRPVRLLGTLADITHRKTLELALAEEHALLAVTLDSISDAVLCTDAEGRVLRLNPAAERLLGWRIDEARGRAVEDVFTLLDEQQQNAAKNPVRLCLQRGETVGVGDYSLLRNRSGMEFVVEDSASPMRGEDGRLLGVVTVFRDVSEQRQLVREMSYRAAHDALTGLINRAEFERRLQGALESAQLQQQVHALLFIDLDQFKLLNDACGHSVGDQVLQQVSGLIGECVRSGDLLARLGGDEFGAILQHCRLDQAQRAAQKICERMEDFRFEHDGRRFRIGASIGLVPIERDWPDVATLMQAADTCCYAAKEAGRNRVHAWMNSDEAMLQRRDSMRWASRIESALDEDRFELFAQRILPVDGSEDPRGEHLELLLRLREDTRLVAPGAFLPAAERFHLATRIDRWVLRHAFAWLDAHPSAAARVGTLAINLSGQSLGDRAFHRFVGQLLREAQFDLRRLCFEITETAAITALSEATSFITELRRQGVRVALDDFGAGASSFGYLKQLPVDYIKIDGQFIRNLHLDALDRATVDCFCQVARVLGLRTIAEFVDSEEALAVLRELGVEQAQGYLLHRPEPLDSLFPG